MKALHLGVMLLAALLLVGQALTQGVVSTRLSDTISKGAGNIDLLKDLNAAALESYRSANAGRLVFGVDINEAASGTEKASSQGVAVQDVQLEVRFADGSTRVYGPSGQFWTETQVLVAPAGQTVRGVFYTLLGESGSNRITASNAVQGQFDSTLKITVPDSLAGAVSAVLRVRLLDTDDRRGDPEAFYGHSGGFEDLAILTPADARYIDVQVPRESSFRTQAPAMELSPEGEATQLEEAAANPPPESPSTGLSWVTVPSASRYFIAAYEDLKPARGDYDFNDVVVAYRYRLGVDVQGRVERLEGEAFLVARGSTYRHGWTLDLPLPASVQGMSSCSTRTTGDTALPCQISVGEGQLRWTPFPDTVAALPVTGGIAASPANTPAGAAFMRGPKATFSAVLTAPTALTAPGAGEPWLAVHTTGQTVHLADRDPAGFPFAMLMASAWKVPQERADMGLAYPRLQAFIESAGAQSSDWFRQPEPTLVRPWSEADWAW